MVDKQKHPQKRNQTSFTSTNRPPRCGRPKKGEGGVATDGSLTKTAIYDAVDHVVLPPQGGRPKGSRNKKTEAQEAFAAMGYNPTEIQITLAKQIQEMLERGEDDDGKKFTISRRCMLIDQLASINDKLMSYQSAKAIPSVEQYKPEGVEEEAVPVTAELPTTEPAARKPLSITELIEARKSMTQQATINSLQGRIG